VTGRARSHAVLLLAAVAGMLLVAVLSTVGDSAAEIGQGWVPGIDELEPAPPDDAVTADPDQQTDTPPALRAALAVMLVVLLLVLGVMFLVGLLAVIIGFQTSKTRRVLQGEVANSTLSEETGTADINLIAAAAVKAGERLRVHDGGDPGDAVVAAWLLLEEATAGAGLTRRPHQTPTEFTTAVLTGLDVDATALHRLRTLYQRARFSSRPVTEDDVDAARVALDRLVADLRAPAGSTA